MKLIKFELGAVFIEPGRRAKHAYSTGKCYRTISIIAQMIDPTVSGKNAENIQQSQISDFFAAQL